MAHAFQNAAQFLQLARVVAGSANDHASLSPSSFFVLLQGGFRQQAFDEGLCVKFHQVVDLLADADEADGQTEVLPHRDRAAAAGRAVELGQHHAGGVGGLAELLGLADGVLARNGVEHQQHLKARLGAGLLDAAEILDSSSIRPFLLCRRPAVSAMTMS